MRVLQVQAFHHLSISARSVVLVSSYSAVQHQTDQLLLPNADLTTKKKKLSDPWTSTPRIAVAF